MDSAGDNGERQVQRIVEPALSPHFLAAAAESRAVPRNEDCHEMARQEAAAQWRERLRTTRRMDRPAAAMGSARAYAALVASALQSMATRLAAVSKGAVLPTGGTAMTSSFVISEHLLRDATRIHELLDPDAVLRMGPCSVVEWLESLPTACASVSLYSQLDVVSVCSRISHPITALLHLLDRVSSDDTLPCAAPPAEGHLRLALDSMRAMCVDPMAVADEMLATMLYTMEAPVGGTVANAKLYGPKRCFYAVMNWALRTFHDTCTPLTADEETVLRRTIGIFLPAARTRGVFPCTIAAGSSHCLPRHPRGPAKLAIWRGQHCAVGGPVVDGGRSSAPL